MAPSSGIYVLPIVMRVARHALKKASNVLRAVEARTQFSGPVQPLLARNTPRQPVHPFALLKQNKGRWYTTHSTLRAGSRQFSTGPAGRTLRASFAKSQVGAAISRLSFRTPFASTLRPNLTGGVLPRVASGYTLGGGARTGARFFSHGPAAPAQVINNVSMGVRAFCLSGKQVQYDGTDRKSGAKRFKTVTPLTKQVAQKLQAVPKTIPGSYITFQLSPTVTALSAFNNTVTLDGENVLANLSMDFSRSLRDIYGVLADLSRLSSLGSLPVKYLAPSHLRVHFPGCDAETVERICLDLGVERGVITQDADYDTQKDVEMALLFPFAPSTPQSLPSPPPYYESHAREQITWQDLLTPTNSPDSRLTDLEYTNLSPGQLGCSSLEINQFSSISSSISSAGEFFQPLDEIAPIRTAQPSLERSRERAAEEFEGLEGIYRFLEECDAFQR